MARFTKSGTMNMLATSAECVGTCDATNCGRVWSSTAHDFAAGNGMVSAKRAE